MAFEAPSVWKEEVNLALIDYTKKILTYERCGKPFTPHVQMRKPLESIKFEAYPCVTWYNIMDLPNVYRTDNLEHPVEYNRETGKIKMAYTPTPYDMYYQIDFWGRNWGDIDEMSMVWLQSLPPYSRGIYFNLPVIDSLGNKTSVLCVQKDVLRRRDTLTDGDRIFHSTMEYSIQGYLGSRYGEESEHDVIKKICVGQCCKKHSGSSDCE